jgi:hypothetical protein
MHCFSEKGRRKALDARRIILDIWWSEVIIQFFFYFNIMLIMYPFHLTPPTYIEKQKFDPL